MGPLEMWRHLYSGPKLPSFNVCIDQIDEIVTKYLHLRAI